jgi:nitrogen fixation NifU-like protein
MEYSFKVLDRFNNRKHEGKLDEASAAVGTGMVGSPVCGDVMKVQILVDDQGRITDAKFQTFGCGSAVASTDLACEQLIGKTLDEALGIKNSDLAKTLELPPVKIHCSVLAEDAIRGAIADLKKKRGEA